MVARARITRADVEALLAGPSQAIRPCWCARTRRAGPPATPSSQRRLDERQHAGRAHEARRRHARPTTTSAPYARYRAIYEHARRCRTPGQTCECHDLPYPSRSSPPGDHRPAVRGGEPGAASSWQRPRRLTTGSSSPAGVPSTRWKAGCAGHRPSTSSRPTMTCTASRSRRITWTDHPGKLDPPMPPTSDLGVRVFAPADGIRGLLLTAENNRDAPDRDPAPSRPSRPSRDHPALPACWRMAAASKIALQGVEDQRGHRRRGGRLAWANTR